MKFFMNINEVFAHPKAKSNRNIAFRGLRHKNELSYRARSPQKLESSIKRDKWTKCSLVLIVSCSGSVFVVWMVNQRTSLLCLISFYVLWKALQGLLQVVTLIINCRRCNHIVSQMKAYEMSWLYSLTTA